MDARSCLLCGSSFTPNKYSPGQKICSSPACQKKRQLESMRVWRELHPQYFKFDESKGIAWLQAQRKRSKLWRQKNPDKVRSYRRVHLEEYRLYMRAYMRRYRGQKKPVEGQASPENSL